MENIINIHKNERSDSFEIGTPSKGGVIKIYFNSENKEEAEQLIKKAMRLRKFGETEYEQSKSVE